MLKIKWIKRYLPATALLLLTTGCANDMYYVSAKDRQYNIAPAFANNKITHDSWVDEQDQSSARYTSSNLVARERYHSAVLGNLHFKQSDNPNEESTEFAIRKENRAYLAETPVFNAFNIGKHRVTPNFSVGHHKDHKVMAGLKLRMPF